MRGSTSTDQTAARVRWATTIGKVCDEFGGDVQTGPFGSQLHASDYSDSGTPIVMPQDMRDGQIVEDQIARVGQKHVELLKRHRLRAGDVVFSRRGDVTRFAVVSDENEGWLCGTGSLRIRLNSPKIDVRYLRHYLQQEAIGNWLKHHAKGVTMPNLNTQVIRALPFVYPPIEEQQRIAAILDKADALRAKRHAALAQLDTLTQSIFLDMFGDPASNSKGWPLARVSDFVAEFQGGKSIEAESGDDVVTRNRVLKISAVTTMKFLPTESKPLPDSYAPPNEHFVRAGDLLFSRANTSELVGAVALVGQTPPNLLLPDKLWRFVWRRPAQIEPCFVWALFQTAEMRYEIGRRATGTSGSMKNISQEKVLEIQTILPPVSAQRDFVDRLNGIDAMRTCFESSGSEIDALFASLQHRAFRGEL